MKDWKDELIIYLEQELKETKIKLSQLKKKIRELGG